MSASARRTTMNALEVAFLTAAGGFLFWELTAFATFAVVEASWRIGREVQGATALIPAGFVPAAVVGLGAFYLSGGGRRGLWCSFPSPAVGCGVGLALLFGLKSPLSAPAFAAAALLEGGFGLLGAMIASRLWRRRGGTIPQ